MLMIMALHSTDDDDDDGIFFAFSQELSACTGVDFWIYFFWLERDANFIDFSRPCDEYSWRNVVDS
jgi:hypothetical protein